MRDNIVKSLLGRPVYRVERMGALLSVVLDRHNILAAGRATKRMTGPSLDQALGLALHSYSPSHF